MKLPRAAFLGFVILYLPQPAAAAEPAVAGVDAEIRELGRRWLDQHDGIGLSIGVYDDGRRSFYNFGATRLDGDRAPTKDTVYEIGSIGKTMTGQLLARAIVEGRGGLNDEAAKYLSDPYPNLENGGEKVRLLHLANMTSQLTDIIPDVTQVRVVPGEPLAATRMRVFEKYTREEFLRQLRRIGPTRAPGSDPARSNIASVLLGVVLEKLYGEPFETLLAREIEKPLRMGSGVAPQIKLLAKGYTRNDEELPSFGAKMSHAANSLRYSTDDLLKYAAWQLVERDASVKLAHRPTWMTTDQRRAVAFYWIILESPHGRRVQYSGSTYGFTSMCDLYPESKIAVVLQSNKTADGMQESLRALSAKIVALARPGAESRVRPTEESPPGDPGGGS